MASPFKHNKKRNTALVYEFLVRRMASQLLDHDKTGYSRTFEITKRYYATGTPLARELELFESIRNVRGVSEQSARKILGEVQNHARSSDLKKIEIKKSNLIKEINHSFGKSFYSDHRVPDYRLLASVQVMLDSLRHHSSISESVQNIQLEESLVGYMASSEQIKINTSSEVKVDGLVCALAARKFQEKYRQTLNGAQKKILEKYMRAMMIGDRENLSRYLLAEKTRIISVLEDSKNMKEMKDDGIMATRLEESLGLIKKLDVSSADDDSVQEIMLYAKLVEELTSNE